MNKLQNIFNIMTKHISNNENYKIFQSSASCLSDTCIKMGGVNILSLGLVLALLNQTIADVLYFVALLTVLPQQNEPPWLIRRFQWLWLPCTAPPKYFFVTE